MDKKYAMTEGRPGARALTVICENVKRQAAYKLGLIESHVSSWIPPDKFIPSAR